MRPSMRGPCRRGVEGGPDPTRPVQPPLVNDDGLFSAAAARIGAEKKVE